MCRLQVTNRLLEKQPNHLTTQHAVKLIEQLNHMISDSKRYTKYVNITVRNIMYVYRNYGMVCIYLFLFYLTGHSAWIGV